MFNAFECLKLPQCFDLDLTDLERAYFQAINQIHPDRKGGIDADGAAAMVNQSYGLLKNSVKRAHHLWSLLSLKPLEEIAAPQDLLEASFEHRLQLEAAATIEKLQDLQDRYQMDLADARDQLIQAFEHYSQEGCFETLSCALHQFSHLYKYVDEIKIKLTMYK